MPRPSALEWSEPTVTPLFLHCGCSLCPFTLNIEQGEARDFSVNHWGAKCILSYLDCVTAILSPDDHSQLITHDNRVLSLLSC